MEKLINMLKSLKRASNIIQLMGSSHWLIRIKGLTMKERIVRQGVGKVKVTHHFGNQAFHYLKKPAHHFHPVEAATKSVSFASGGALIGTSVAGPIGGVIGAVAGAATGVVMAGTPIQK